MLKLSQKSWQDSQKNELAFWMAQKQMGNTEQYHRNHYYLHSMEGDCTIFQDFVQTYDMASATLLDVGSGPQGILHVLKAFRKIAVDPLMDEYRKLGFKVDENDVLGIQGSAEGLSSLGLPKVDVIFCLNMLDHTRCPEAVIQEVFKALRPQGYLLIMTDMRTQGQLDVYHKLPLTVNQISGWLSIFDVKGQRVIPHQEGNPVMQFVGVGQKTSIDRSS